MSLGRNAPWQFAAHPRSYRSLCWRPLAGRSQTEAPTVRRWALPGDQQAVLTANSYHRAYPMTIII